MSTKKRYFLRCSQCLTVAALDLEPTDPLSRYLNGEDAVPADMLLCGICGGTIEGMGYVHGDMRLFKSYEACACDGRCTSARGPVCNCKCGGENHGTGRTVTVQRDLGPVPVVRMPDAPKAKAEATEYRTALKTAQERIAPVRLRYRNREWLERPDFDRLRTFSDGIRKAGKSRTHAARMKILDRLLTA